jgi:hypothetical protein
MEQGKPSNGTAALPSCGHALQSGNSSVDSVLTDAVLNELKEQSPEGCLLCSFDTWDEEEWD